MVMSESLKVVLWIKEEARDRKKVFSYVGDVSN
jgi:hypothetical protein